MNNFSKHITFFAGLIFLLAVCNSMATAGSLGNVRHYRVSDDKVVIYYDLESDIPVSITVAVSVDGGKTFSVKPTALTGDVGENVTAGTSKRIVWEVDKDIDRLPEDYMVRILADRAPLPTPIPKEDDIEPVIAYAVQSPIRLDGLLNESVWKKIEPITGFTQRELTEGAPATEKTEVRILYDRDKLYIGVICYDSEPERIIHKELKQDGDLENDDSFIVVLDTYHDKRIGFYFSVNPNGARFDGRFFGGSGGKTNSTWDGIWDVSSRIMNYGWSCEIEIPFKTLRFPATDIQNWGINFKRIIRRKNEEVLWKGWSRNDGVTQLTEAGTLIIKEPLNRSRHFDLKPYLLSGVEKIINQNMNDTFKYGIDVKYAITSNTMLDLTTKTDFAQVESDREVINLTRFDIRYPEKRDFFLEGNETFTYIQGEDPLYYSRRIGVSPDRKEVPIIGGAKLTQKSGTNRLGIMTVQTGEENSHPSTNYSVVRMKKDILTLSYIGFLFTNLIDADGHDNQVFGVDFNYKTDRFLTNKNFRIYGAIAGSVTDGNSDKNLDGRVSVRYEDDLAYFYSAYQVIQEKFNPEIGFVKRTGVKFSKWNVYITPRPNIPHIKKLVFKPIDIAYYTDIDGRLLERDVNIEPLGIIFNSTDTIHLNAINKYDHLDEDFNIFDDVIIPRGGYEWWSYEAHYSGNRSRPVSFDLSTVWGNFYKGTRNNFHAGSTLKTNSFYAISADMTYNNITIDEKTFDTKEFGGRLAVDLSTRLSTSTFAQYNNETEEVIVNFRIHYIPKIGSDVYIVYNHLLDERENFTTLRNTAILKADFTYRF